MVSVELPEPVTVVGENVPVMPAGKPLRLKFTTPPNPPLGVTVTVYLAARPCLTDTELGEAAIEKSPGVVTDSVTLFECVLVPSVPVIVIVYVPGVVLADVMIVQTVWPEAVTVVGWNTALESGGKPEAVKLTVPAYPLCPVTVVV